MMHSLRLPAGVVKTGVFSHVALPSICFFLRRQRRAFLLLLCGFSGSMIINFENSKQELWAQSVCVNQHLGCPDGKRRQFVMCLFDSDSPALFRFTSSLLITSDNFSTPPRPNKKEEKKNERVTASVARHQLHLLSYCAIYNTSYMWSVEYTYIYKYIKIIFQGQPRFSSVRFV